MTKKLFYAACALFLLLDMWTTSSHLALQKATFCSIFIMLLAIYYFKQRKIQTNGGGVITREYLLYFAYLWPAVTEFLFFFVPSKGLTVIIIVQILRFLLLIFFFLMEPTFYRKNRRKFIIVSIFCIALSLVISLKVVDFFPNSPLDEILCAEMYFLLAIALFRNANRQSYELVVIGVMGLILEISISSALIVSYSVEVEILTRVSNLAGHFILTLGILQGFTSART